MRTIFYIAPAMFLFNFFPLLQFFPTKQLTYETLLSHTYSLELCVNVPSLLLGSKPPG